jgi:hypothetical protein
MARGDSRVAQAQDHTPYTATLPSDFNQTLRNSLTKSLESYYTPLEQIPPELNELLERLEEAAQKQKQPKP